MNKEMKSGIAIALAGVALNGSRRNYSRHQVCSFGKFS